MLYHFAITPEAFEPTEINEMKPPGVVLVQLLHGICDNGLLANLHAGQWMTYVRRNQAHKDVPAAVRDRIESCLSILHSRNRFVRHPEGSPKFESDDFRWLHWSLERHQSDPLNPLSAIFSSDDYIELSGLTDEVLIRLSVGLEAECWTGRQRSVRFTKTESNLRIHLAPIVRYAQKVTLIDPYMTCREDRFLNTIQHCADLLGKRDGGQIPGIIHIHAGDPETVGPEGHQESKEARLNRWQQALEPFAKQWKHSFRVILWKRKPGGRTFHDRYIITDQCGLEAPGGFDFLPDEDEHRANITTWSLLDADHVRSTLLDEFHHSKSPYDYLGSQDIEP